MLSEKGKDRLLTLAREALWSHLTGKSSLVAEAPPEELMAPRGAFVSLHRAGDLRGCIGTFEATESLFKTVQSMAIASGTRDPRFDLVTADELDAIEIEISVLSPRRTIRDVNEIVVGQHGLYVTSGYRHGVLLPQVATDCGWDAETFLSHTCQKAGLPADAWKGGDIKLEVFEAEVFSETPKGSPLGKR